MLTISHLSDEQLRQTIRHLAVRDRTQILELVFHLAEVEERQLHLHWGFGSLWDYCGRELLLKDGVAYLRITLARLVSRRPELKPLLSDGRLGLCTACDLWAHVGNPAFGELVQAALGMSKQDFRDFLGHRGSAPAPRRDIIRRTAAGPDAGLELPTLNLGEPAPSGPQPPPSTRTAKATEPAATGVVPAAPVKMARKTHRITFSATEDDVAMLRRLQDLMGTHDVGEVVRAALDKLLDTKDEQRRAARRRRRQAKTQAAAVAIAKPTRQRGPSESRDRPRRPRVALADEVKLRDEGRCAFVAEDGTQCMERRFLQIDHVVPYACGGSSTDGGNLRSLCQAHNLFLAREAFGAKVPRRDRKQAAALQPVEVVMQLSSGGVYARASAVAPKCGAPGGTRDELVVPHSGPGAVTEGGSAEARPDAQILGWLG